MIAAPGPAQPGTLDPGYRQLKRLVVERTGHAYYEDKDDILFERLRRRLLASGARGFDDYLHRLGDGPRGQAEWAALVSEITVGETFFFRFAEQFQALRQVVLPELVARNAEARRLRIWSAGASNGAEAHSLAIVVREVLGDAADDWRIAILGTDIDETALAQARAGVYGRWSLRSMAAEERDRWFLPGERPQTWRVRPEYRRLVRFETHNLVGLLDGAAPLQFTDFDLVFCRNVLIYFSQPTVAALVGVLGAALAEHGRLFLGHAETNPQTTAAVVPVETAGVTIYRRRLPGEGLPAPADAAPGPARTAGSLPAMAPAAWARRAAPPAARRSPPPSAPAAASPPSSLDAVRSCADRGDLAGALSAARAGAVAHPLEPAYPFFAGVVLRARGEPESAAQALRQALYLDRGFVMAHWQLGLALLDLGREALGRRSIANAARLAAAMPSSAPVPEGDGLTAAGLLDAARLLLGRPPS